MSGCGFPGVSYGRGREDTLLSSPLFTFGGAGRKLGWLRGREILLEDSLPPVSPLHP